MFIRAYQSPNYLDTSVRNAFERYRPEIIALHKQQWKDEDIHGEACQQQEIMQYYAAIYFVAILQDIFKNGTKTWNEILKKYDVKDKRKKFACHGIDLDLIFEDFGLPPAGECGIEGMDVENTFEVEAQHCGTGSEDAQCPTGIQHIEVEDTFEVEPEEVEVSCEQLENIDIQELLNDTCECVVYIESPCEC